MRHGTLLTGGRHMAEFFLSASVPVQGRGTYFETADPFLIQFAVRELLSATIRDHVVVWGGHPAITPMVWAVCEDLGIQYARSVILYQSAFFADVFPEENARFGNVELISSVDGDRDASLLRMRTAMLARPSLKAAVFVGGMEGVEAEFRMFRQHHQDAGVVAVGAPGGAARDLALSLNAFDPSVDSVDFAGIFRKQLLPLLD